MKRKWQNTRICRHLGQVINKVLEQVKCLRNKTNSPVRNLQVRSRQINVNAILPNVNKTKKKKKEIKLCRFFLEKVSYLVIKHENSL